MARCGGPRRRQDGGLAHQQRPHDGGALPADPASGAARDPHCRPVSARRPQEFTPELVRIVTRSTQSLRMDVSQARHLRLAAFQDLLRAWPGLAEAEAICDEPGAAQLGCVDEAFCDQAMACLPGLQRLTCTGFLPCMPPQRLRCLTVSLDSAASLHLGPAALEQLLVRLQPCVRLRSVTLQLWGFRWVHLRDAALAGLELPALGCLGLRFSLLKNASCDLTWLSRPRGFCAEVTVCDRLSQAGQGGVHVQRFQLTQQLAGALSGADILTLECCKEPLSEEEQRVLGVLRVQAVRLTLPTQRILVCPNAQLIHVVFQQGTSQVPQVAWQALNCACLEKVRLVLEPGMPSLAVFGFDGLPSGRPWRLEVPGVRCVAGLPRVVEQASCPGGYVLQNEAAALLWE